MSHLVFWVVPVKKSGWVRAKPFLLHQDASIRQNSPDFVDNDLDLDQQPAVVPPCGDVTLHPVVGEAGESERAVGAHVETWTIERLDNPAAKCPASVWKNDQLKCNLFLFLAKCVNNATLLMINSELNNEV